jgi:ribonuclease HI
VVVAEAPNGVKWLGVKALSGHAENDRVDALACAEADDQRRHHRL